MNNNYYFANLEVERVEFPNEETILYLRNSVDAILDAKKCFGGEALNVIYSVNIRLANRQNYSNMEYWKIENAIKAYIMVKGEDALNADDAMDFVKHYTGIDACFDFETVYKTYIFRYADNTTYKSKPKIVELKQGLGLN